MPVAPVHSPVPADMSSSGAARACGLLAGTAEALQLTACDGQHALRHARLQVWWRERHEPAYLQIMSLTMSFLLPQWALAAAHLQRALGGCQRIQALRQLPVDQAHAEALEDAQGAVGDGIVHVERVTAGTQGLSRMGHTPAGGRAAEGAHAYTTPAVQLELKAFAVPMVCGDAYILPANDLVVRVALCAVAVLTAREHVKVSSAGEKCVSSPCLRVGAPLHVPHWWPGQQCRGEGCEQPLSACGCPSARATLVACYISCESCMVKSSKICAASSAGLQGLHAMKGLRNEV